jgi:hypothetical protein
VSAPARHVAATAVLLHGRLGVAWQEQKKKKKKEEKEKRKK